MDQSQWKALNQMIAKQTSSGTSQKTSSSGAAQTQYKTVLTGGQQQHIILSGNSTQASTSVVGRPAGQRVARQSVNGATRSQPTGAGDTEIVKSLLTGRQYGQSILRPDIVSRGGRQAGRSGAQKTAGKQMSLLQTNYQQSQVQVDAGQTSSIQLDQNLLQQLVCSPEMMSAAPGPGEVMYVMAGNVTYQIVGPSQPGAEVTAIPVASGISLDELATISAQQESLKPEQLAGYQLQQAGDASSATMVLQDMLHTGLDGQQYLQAGLDGTITTTTDDGMQIVMMSGDGYTGGTESTAQFGREGDGASTIKLGGQDFILQAGQTLPPELQEMVDKGLPIDWSKYEFVIEGGENGPETTDAATFMMQQAAAADQSEALRLQEMAMLHEAGTGSEVDSFAAGADYVKTESNDDMSAHASMGVQFVTAAPGEYDDGEFSYLASPTRDEDPSQASGEVEPRVIPYSGFLHSFLDFVQGKGTETLSSVANSAVTGKPPMPKYVPPETGSKAKDDLQKKYKGTPMTIIYTDASDPTGGSYIVTKSVEDPQVEKGKHTVGKRKRSQLDSEGEDGSLENAEKMYRLSEDDFDSKKQDDSNPTRGRGRGRGRSSSAGRPVISDTDRHLGVMSLLDSTVPDSAVIHVTQSEPHCFQKGDFVIDRKDAYKLDSYPIWRIENGKLLQKFDPSFEDGILVHKSASVYSSWSGDIRDNFKPIMVEVISQTATTVGRKQDITVHVLDKYKTKAPDDSLEQNPLLQLFNIYVQMLLNHAVDSNYLLAVQEQKVDYYLTPMNQIDHLLMEAEQAVLSEITWNDDFKAELEAWSCYAVVGLRTDQATLCQATPGANKGIMTVKFYGQTYDRNFLAVESETTVANAKEFVIGKATFDNLGIYHSLHHFKFLLFRKCREEVNYVKSTTNGKSYEEAIEECIQNRIWVQQLFLDLKGLLERYIIIKTEDEAVEGDTATAGTL